MAGFQPEIMVINGLHQNGCDTGTVGTQGIGINLVTDQGSFGCGDAVLGKAFVDSFGEGFFRVGNAGKLVFPAELGDPVIVAVGYDAQLDILQGIHLLQPGGHFLRGNSRCVGYDGIIEIQHQQPDVSGPEQLRGDVCGLVRNDLG